MKRAWAGALTILSGNQSTALAAALTSHLIGIISNSLLGAFALSRERRDLDGRLPPIAQPPGTGTVRGRENPIGRF